MSHLSHPAALIVKLFIVQLHLHYHHLQRHLLASQISSFPCHALTLLLRHSAFYSCFSDFSQFSLSCHSFSPYCTIILFNNAEVYMWVMFLQSFLIEGVLRWYCQVLRLFQIFPSFNNRFQLVMLYGSLHFIKLILTYSLHFLFFSQDFLQLFSLLPHI